MLRPMHLWSAGPPRDVVVAVLKGIALIRLIIEWMLWTTRTCVRACLSGSFSRCRAGEAAQGLFVVTDPFGDGFEGRTQLCDLGGESRQRVGLAGSCSMVFDDRP